ncbi:MAG: hypothetical protein AAGG59_08600 [Bacteroidota bacterium]
MKRYVLSIFIGLIPLLSYSQNIPKPEFVDIPYFLDKKSNELVMLSKETIDTKATGIKISYKFSGAESKTKINTSKITLIIDSNSPTLLTAMKIYKLDVKKKSRQVAIMSSNLMGQLNKRNENIIDFNSRNLEGNIYELVISSELDKGEYALTNGMNSYTFSVK